MNTTIANILNYNNKPILCAPLKQERQCISTASLQAWLQETRPKVNPQQFRFLVLVVDRILVEVGLRAPEASVRDASGEEPLRYLLHGPPGTGKSHVLKFVGELFEMIGYRVSMQVPVVLLRQGPSPQLVCDFIPPGILAPLSLCQLYHALDLFPQQQPAVLGHDIWRLAVGPKQVMAWDVC